MAVVYLPFKDGNIFLCLSEDGPIAEFGDTSKNVPFITLIAGRWMMLATTTGSTGRRLYFAAGDGCIEQLVTAVDVRNGHSVLCQCARLIGADDRC